MDLTRQRIRAFAKSVLEKKITSLSFFVKRARVCSKCQIRFQKYAEYQKIVNQTLHEESERGNA